MADIFISYTSSDRDWAFWIAKELESIGHTPHIHEWEIKGGADIYAWMEQQHDVADHVLCVVSDEYLKAPYSTLERNAAIWQAAGKRPGFVLFAAVKPCKFPTLIDHFRRCELYSAVSEEARRARLREFLTNKDAPDRIILPTFAVSNIPIRVPEHFLGREDSVAAIAEALGRHEGRVAITALHGLRGVGKTTLAAAFAERHRGDYRATWWIKAQTADGMRADLVSLGVRLGWIAADEKEEPALAGVMERLRHEGEGILLIYDNAIDATALKPFLPRGGAVRVLVTSNTHAWRGVASPVEIRLWPTEIGADYLIARTGRKDERAAAAELSEVLGGLPLAHEQAAAYCERLEIAFADYRRRFEAAPARLLDTERDAPAEYHDRLTVAKTFGLAIDEAAKLHPAAEPLIVHTALLAPEPIPLFLFAEGRDKLGEPLASALADDGLDEAVAALRSFALVDRESIVDEHDSTTVTNCIRLHRLVRQVAAGLWNNEARDVVRRNLIEAAAATFPRDLWDDSKKWARARRLDALSLALVTEGTMPSDGTEERTAALLNSLGEYRYIAIGGHALVEAQPLLERALAICERALGPEHPTTARSLSDLAIALYNRGDLEGSRSLNERALAIREKVLGSEHPDTAMSLNNLAMVLQSQGNIFGARHFHERALAINQKVFGLDHPTTGLAMSTFARLLQAQGDYAAARSFEERALAIRERAFGSEHHDTAASLNSLATILKAQGDLAAARALYEQALAILERVRGIEHPETATSLNNLANLLRDEGDLPAARTLYERALRALEKIRGPAHPDTNRVRSNFAQLHLAQHQSTEALFAGRAALAALENALGRDHSWTRDSARVTAAALAALGRADEAAALREKYGIERQAE